MKKESFIEEKVLPVVSKISANKVLIAMRDGMTLSMPLLIVGSLFMIIASFPIDAWGALLDNSGISSYLWKGVNSSFGLMGLVAVFGIANSYSKQNGYDGIASGVIALSSFIMVTPFVDGNIPSNYMGASGIFVAMIIGVLSAALFNWFIKKDFQIKLPDSVPPAVARSFSAVIPGACIITLWLVVYFCLDKFGLNMHILAQTILAKPLSLLGGNIFGTVLVIFLNSLFWFVGVHGGNTVNAIMGPVWLANLDANVLAHKAGEALPQIITGPFMDNFVFIGGCGATIGLVIMLTVIAAKKNSSKQTKALAPITLTPGIFNINEPAMFGIPVVLNFKLLIPFILAPVANAIIAYITMAIGLVPRTFIGATWTMPAILSGFITTGSIMGSVLQIVLIIVDVLIYMPFALSIEVDNKKNEEESK